jgi:ABC-type microcin C transport system duplicated ATPase subunit YejF
VLGLLPPPGRIAAGSIRPTPGSWDCREELSAIRGPGSLVFQEPGAALNPVLTIGAQLIEATGAHVPLTREEARRRALALLGRLLP